MAIEVKFTGYVNRVKQFDWGVVYDVAHNQVRMNEANEWITVGKDYFQVYGPAGLKEGQRVEIIGRMKSVQFDRKDGSKGMSLEVKAESMTPVEYGQARGATNNVVATWPAVKEIPNDNAPF